MSYKWNEFGQLTKYAELDEYLNGREYSHTNYFCRLYNEVGH